MRVIDTKTNTFRDEDDFFDPYDKRQKYAILSHRWLKGEEVTKQHFDRGSKRNSYGWEKIEKCCELAQREGIPYAWVDTCCIDKTNSAESSESIQSMFAWYREAEVCYAFLHDFPSTRGEEDVSEALPPTEGMFDECEWFDRGWTLQELLAPKKLVFFDHAYNRIGLLSDHEIIAEVSRRTGIDEYHLHSPGSFRQACVGKRMSWIARRDVTKPEDIAYCMLGIFDVNMPVLYGEGREKAFLRLQEQIIASSDDESIFAWEPMAKNTAYEDVDEPSRRGMLAEDPKEFRSGGSLEVWNELALMVHHPLRLARPSYTLNNGGLQFPVLTLLNPLRTPGGFEVALNCRRPDHDEDPGRTVTLRLCHTKVHGKDVWYRAMDSPSPSSPSKFHKLREAITFLAAEYTQINVARSSFDAYSNVAASLSSFSGGQPYGLVGICLVQAWVLIVSFVCGFAFMPLAGFVDPSGQLTQLGSMVVWSSLTIGMKLARWRLWFPCAFLALNVFILGLLGAIPWSFWTLLPALPLLVVWATYIISVDFWTRSRILLLSLVDDSL